MAKKIDTKAINRAVAIAGSQAALSTQINVSPQEVWQWCSGHRPVPAKHCIPIETATDVSRHDLLPSVFGKKGTEQKAA